MLHAMNSLYSIESWPRGRPTERCRLARNYGKVARYLVSYPSFSSNNRKVLVRAERAMCSDHAKRYADQHGLQMPRASASRSLSRSGNRVKSPT
jgi:hypothetical protein